MGFFEWFQIVVLALFYIIFVGRMLHMWVKGTNPFVIGAGKKGIPMLIEYSFFAGLLVWSYEIAAHSLGIAFHILPKVLHGTLFNLTILQALGAALIAVGLVIFTLSLISFGDSWRIGIDKKKAGALVTGGVFSITRNPIFVFLDFYVLGTWLIIPNLFFGIFAVVTIIGIHWQILEEEKFLMSQYGNEYRDYMKKVGRYISTPRSA